MTVDGPTRLRELLAGLEADAATMTLRNFPDADWPVLRQRIYEVVRDATALVDSLRSTLVEREAEVAKLRSDAEYDCAMLTDISDKMRVEKARADAAETQARLGWQRAREKDAAYGEALAMVEERTRERDEARAHLIDAISEADAGQHFATRAQRAESRADLAEQQLAAMRVLVQAFRDDEDEDRTDTTDALYAALSATPSSLACREPQPTSDDFEAVRRARQARRQARVDAIAALTPPAGDELAFDEDSSLCFDALVRARGILESVTRSASLAGRARAAVLREAAKHCDAVADERRDASGGDGGSVFAAHADGADMCAERLRVLAAEAER